MIMRNALFVTPLSLSYRHYRSVKITSTVMSHLFRHFDSHCFWSDIRNIQISETPY